MQSLAGASTPDWLRQRAQTTPDRLALLINTERFSFADLDRRTDAALGGLVASGIAPGDVVPLLAGNSADFVQTLHAVARLGAVLMPLNTRLTPAEAAWQLRDAGATQLLYDIANVDAAESIQRELPDLRLVRIDALDSAAPPLAAQERFDLTALQTVVYTSGTTGRPKGAMLSYGNHLWSAVASSLNLGLLPEDRWLACLPLFHVGGLSILIKSVVYGMPVVLHVGFDPERVNSAIDEDGVTMISVVAAMLRRMLDARGGRPYPASLRCVLLGGGPAPEPLLCECESLGIPVVQTYGLTETASQIVTLAPEDALPKLGSAGKPLFGSEILILDEDGADCEVQQPGEIVLRGPTVTSGYLNHPEDSARALRDGWLHTGDIGYLDEAGYLYVLDRRDDLIVSGGENVYPAEIEAALQGHPAVLEAGVFGVADERWTQVPLAVVVLREGMQASAEDLLVYLRERLAVYKLPRRIEFMGTLPRNAAGKLMRSELRAIFR